MPAVIPLIIAGVSAAGSVAAAKMSSNAARDAAGAQTDAAKFGATTQDAAAQRAEAFQRQEAENQWLNSQNTQKANYEQSKARYGSIAGVASQYGLNLAGMPDYAPGIDPRYTDPSTPAPGTVAGAVGPSSTGSPSAFLKGLLDQGLDPQQAAAKTNSQFNLQTGAQAQYYAPSAQTSGKAVIGLPDAYISQEPSGWALTQRSGGSGTIAGAAKMPQNAMTAPTLATPTVNTAIPTPYQPGTIGAQRRMY